MISAETTGRTRKKCSRNTGRKSSRKRDASISLAIRKRMSTSAAECWAPLPRRGGAADGLRWWRVDRATMPKSRKFMLRDMVGNCAILCFKLRDRKSRNKEVRIMPKRLREEDLASIVDVVRQSADGARRSDIAKALKDVPQRTLQYWLKNLVGEGRLA
jgi:hypothetical protein